MLDSYNSLMVGTCFSNSTTSFNTAAKCLNYCHCNCSKENVFFRKKPNYTLCVYVSSTSDFPKKEYQNGLIICICILQIPIIGVITLKVNSKYSEKDITISRFGLQIRGILPTPEANLYQISFNVQI